MKDEALEALRTKLRADPQGCGDNCLRAESERLLGDSMRLRAGQPAQFEQALGQIFNDVTSRRLCRPGCEWPRLALNLYHDVQDQLANRRHYEIHKGTR